MIYLAGYHGRKPEALLHLSQQLDAVVVDIRYSPHSRMPGWDQKDLIKLLHANYMWAHPFGNENFNNDEPIKIVNMQDGVNLLKRRRVNNYILLCACKDGETCHRKVVGEFIKANTQQEVREVTEEEWAAATTYGEENYALSIQQPWAWLILNAGKLIENRNWTSNYRGELYIHTGVKFDQNGYDTVKLEFPDVAMPAPEDFERGGIVGKVNMVDVVTESDSDWFIGPYGFVFENPERVDFVKLRGRQSIFSFDFPPKAGGVEEEVAADVR